MKVVRVKEVGMKIRSLAITLCLLFSLPISVFAEEGHKIHMQLSKTGLNRISNPPYKITDVIGDSSKFRLQSDTDGANIYLMPMGRVGEHIEISIKNNIGKVQDFDFKIADIKGQIIVVEDKQITENSFSVLKKDISQMLQSMRNGQKGKFFVEKINQLVIGAGSHRITALDSYKWKDIKGVRFEIENTKNTKIAVEDFWFPKRWKSVMVHWSSARYLEPKEKALILMIFRNREEG